MDRGRRLGAEVRVERDQPLDLVERPAHVAREPHELLARQPAVLALDRHQRRHQAGAGELPRAGLGAGRAALHPQAHAAVDLTVPGGHHAPSLAVAASCVAALPTRSRRTAQNLNSGILPSGSISSIVSRFAAASRKWNGTKHVPGVSRCESRARSSIDPRRDVTRTKSPEVTPSCSASPGFMYTCASGWIA